MELVFASRNANKINEINKLLGKGFSVISMEDAGVKLQIEETGNTLDENAYLKAKHTFQLCRKPSFADDSGLEVLSLNNAPGVYSSRYSGPGATDDSNMNLLLKNLEHIENREAQFRTVITLILNPNESYRFEGRIRGRIITEKRGTNGFGYDPIFVPLGYTKTFAEMTLEEKNKISHRAKAFAQMKDFLVRS